MPAAGKGARLGLPYSKHLHRLEPDYSLIDYSLEEALRIFPAITTLNLVVTIETNSVWEYLTQRYGNRLTLNKILVDDHGGEYTLSIKLGMQDLNCDYLILLPDSHWKCSLLPNEIHQIIQDNSANNKISFFTKTADQETLKRRGAFQLDSDGRIAGYFDKPNQEKVQLCSSYWGAFYLPKGNLGLDYMHQSTNQLELDQSLLRYILHAAPIPLDHYFDLGTWAEIKLFCDEILNP